MISTTKSTMLPVGINKLNLLLLLVDKRMEKNVRELKFIKVLVGEQATESNELSMQQDIKTTFPVWLICVIFICAFMQFYICTALQILIWIVKINKIQHLNGMCLGFLDANSMHTHTKHSDKICMKLIPRYGSMEMGRVKKELCRKKGTCMWRMILLLTLNNHHCFHFRIVRMSV